MGKSSIAFSIDKFTAFSIDMGEIAISVVFESTFNEAIRLLRLEHFATDGTPLCNITNVVYPKNEGASDCPVCNFLKEFQDGT